MTKLQIFSTAWPDIEIFLVSILCYQHALQWVYFIAKSFIYGYFDITDQEHLAKSGLSPQ